MSPQHLQAQDRFLENHLHFHLESLCFRPWGFRTLQIDHQALAGGNLAVSEASGIFADGLAFDIPGSDAPPPPKVLAPYLEGDDTSVDVFLAIPPHLEGGMNIAMSAKASDARYSASMITLRDDNTGLTERPVQVARKNFRLLAGSEAREGMPLLRVARVSKSPNGLLELDPDFVPPAVSLDASSYLKGILRRLVEILVAKSGTLAGMRRQRNISLADFTSGDIANFWLLYTVNTHLPQLRHLLEVRGGHPEPVFSNMTALAGALTTFSRKFDPSDLPAYDHDNLGPCFRQLDESLRAMLETVVPQNFVTLPLKLTENSIYSTAIPDEQYLNQTRWYLAVKSTLPEADLITLSPRLMKVCSATHIDHLVRQALPGVTMLHEARPPAAIPIRLDYQYFSLNQSGPAWEAIRRARNFAVYAPSDFREPQLELVILLPAANA